MHFIYTWAEFKDKICRFRFRTWKYGNKSVTWIGTENYKQCISGSLEFNSWNFECL